MLQEIKEVILARGDKAYKGLPDNMYLYKSLQELSDK